MTRRALRLGAMLAALVCLYTLSLLAAYSFDDAWIEKNVQAARAVLREEANMPGDYATYFWHSGFGITDNVTDLRIYEGLLRGERSVVEAAMRTDYLRYWHGYAVILRPLMAALSITHVRYIAMMGLMGLWVLCCLKMARQLGTRAALLFALSLLMSFFLIAPFCQQYVTVYAVTLLGCLAALWGWPWLRERLPEWFLLLGSLTCFLDFLTFPVLALGYPLVCCQLMRLRDGKEGLWGETLALTAVWMAAYGLTWLGKGAVGTLLTGQDVFQSIWEQVLARTTGAMDTGERILEVSAAGSIAINVETFFFGANAALFLAVCLWLACRALRAHPRRWGPAMPVAVVALFPLAWYAVMQNHTRVHFWMTHKQLSVTVFALWAYLLAVELPCKGSLPDGLTGRAKDSYNKS